MVINVNNQPKEISKNSSITQLLKHLNQPENGIAVAVNNQIVTKTNWAIRQVVSGDNILIIQATQGG